MDAALGLLESKGFSSLSLREVTREVGVVPTAFYRHFADMEELGLALVDESFGALREMLKEARADTRQFEHVIRGSMEILVRYVHSNRPQFLFVVRERFGGVAGIRYAIRSEIRLFSSELATDLSRFPGLTTWTTEDLNIMAGLIVNTMVSTVEGILEAPATSPEAEAEVIRIAERQLLMIALGAGVYKRIDG